MPAYDRLAFLPVLAFLAFRGLEVFDTCVAKGSAFPLVFLALVVCCFVTRGIKRVAACGLMLAAVKHRIDAPAFAWDPSGHADLAGKVVVITGANSGIGLSLARELSGPAHNATVVIMACRSVAKCEKVAPAGAECMRLDLADLASVESFAQEVTSRFPRLDFLVNNAGLVSGPGARTKQGYELNLGVMHLGHFLLTRLLLPLLTKGEGQGTTGRGAARIVNHASAAMQGGRVDWLEGDAMHDLKGEQTDGCYDGVFSGDPEDMCPLTGSYSRAKLAQVMFTQELQVRLDTHRAARVALLHDDGPAATKKEAGALTAPRQVIVATLHPGIVSSGIVEMSDWLARPTVGGARVIIQCMLDPDVPGGAYVDEMGTPHDLLKDVNPASTRHSWYSTAVMGYQQGVRGEAEKWRAKMWEVSEREIARHVTALPAAPEGWE